MRKFKVVASLALITTMLVSMVACSKPASDASSTSSLEGSTVEAVSVKENYYDAINGEWLSTTTLGPSDVMTGTMSGLSEEVEKVLKDDFAEMIDGTKEPDSEELANFIEFYRLFLNFEQREADGTEPIQPIIAPIEGLSSLEDFASNWVEWDADLNYSPFMISVQADMMDASKNSLYISSPALLLGAKEYYEDEATKESLQGIWSESKQKVLEMIGKTPEEAATIIEQAMAFDESLVPYTKSAVEKSDITKGYNPISLAQFDGYMGGFDFTTIFTEMFGTAPETVIIDNPAYFEAFSTILNEDTFAQFKSWMLIQTVSAYSDSLNEEIRVEDGAFNRALAGIAEGSTKEESAYSSASAYFAEIVGIYYGKTYFGEEGKQDVTKMVNEIVAIYKERLTNNTWLSEETREKALLKLDSMILNIGYPEKASPMYDGLTVVPESEGGKLIENSKNIAKTIRANGYKKLNQPVDKSVWALPASTVNAMYSFTSNSINMTAAILQAPIYSVDQSPSKNYGAVGAIIAHEISHAFDTNGSLYDENGSLSNWWTEEDYAKFGELSQAMIDEFDGVGTEYGKINGTLTLTENIADAGGLSCALDAAKKDKDVNLEEFFESWAVLWKQKATPEYEAIVVTTDVHAPNKERVNIQLQNLDDFYTTYDIKEGDGMYLAPDKRVSIW